MRVIGIFLLTVGAAMLVGAIPYFLYQSRISREEQVELAQFRQDIAAWGDSLSSAGATEDSALAREGIASRQLAISRLTYHAAPRQEHLHRWWHLTGSGTVMLVAGVLLMIVGGLTLRHALTAPWNLPPLDERYRAQG